MAACLGPNGLRSPPFFAMKTLTKSLIKYAALLATGSISPIASTAAFAQTDVQPQVISNIATVEWDSGAERMSAPSNLVEFAVKRQVVPPPTLSLYHFSQAPGAVQQVLPTTMCVGSAGSVPIALNGAFSSLSTSPASLIPATAIRAGEPLVIAVDAASKNSDPNTLDRFETTIVTANGDRERIILTETGVNNGRFVGVINTRAIPPTPVHGDCVLSVTPGDKLSVEIDDTITGTAVGSGTVSILIDPFGLTFDSGDGSPVTGTRVTIINAQTGAPAQVFGDDGQSAFPNSVITGSTITDSGGNIYRFDSGFYRFPFLAAGTYRLLIEPITPYRHPSTATPAEIALLTRPDGGQFVVAPGSYGGTITLSDPAPIRIDIPLDRPGGALIIRKQTSTNNAMPGDVVQFRISVSNPDRLRNSGVVTITDRLPSAMRLRKNSVRYDGVSVIPTVSADGSSFSALLPALGAGKSGTLTYLAEIRQDAVPGAAVNLASASDSRGAVSATADAAVRITHDGISERFTLIGRITEGGCTLNPDKSTGVTGVRVILEDGTYTVTDNDGRYHFEGLTPGIHVVQVEPSTFPLDQAPINCAKNTRAAGSAISRFVEGRGGRLKRADFRSQKGVTRTTTQQTAPPLPEVLSDVDASGGNRDWVADQTPGTGFLFPYAGYNPRVPVIRAAIKHMVGQKIDLTLNDKPISALNYDGMKKSSDGQVRVSVWRALELQDGSNKLVAIITDENGKTVETLTRIVHVASAPINAEFLRSKSILIADGVTRPRIAVRLTDRNGLPIQHDAVGAFTVNSPYMPAIEADTQQAAQLSGLERAAPVWRVHGDEGVAYIELEPTTASGTLSVNFNFKDGKVERAQKVETWLDPGDRPWTVVGLAAGTIGFNKLSEGSEALNSNEDDITIDGRIALYAKGRVSGKWLMTMSYDSDKKAAETRFAGTIDPRQYYTIYADRTQQRYEAVSVRNLYLKLERPQFYALFGDYQTGIDEPLLARYQRSFNGLKAEYRSDRLQVQAFAADTPYRYRREEIQGNGLSGPYPLAARDILANSERIRIETRDRLRSDRIIETRELIRHIDYDIDYLAGTLRFREPILSRSSNLDAQFIVAEYEVTGVAQRVKNAGGRVRLTDGSGKLLVGATALHDETDRDTTNLIGTDIVYRPGVGTAIRAEYAGSNGKAKTGNATADAGGAAAWLVEAEHHNSKLDVLAYVRHQSAHFGVGQNNRSEIGTRKYGVDARLRLSDKLSISALGYQEDYLESNARRRAGAAELEYRNGPTTLRTGIAHADDKLANGSNNVSTIAKLSASQRMLGDRLEITGQTEFAIGGRDESVDFPARHSVGARFAVRKDVQLVAGYEIAKGQNIDARTARLGFDITPWSGGRVTASANKQEITEYGPRSFAAYGLAQSFRLSEKMSVDLTVDGNKTLNGIKRADVINPLHPVASGGFLGSDKTLTEDFTALTAGLTYHGARWSWTGRAEYRDGETTNRYGVTAATIRQIGEGRAIGGLLTYFRARQNGAATTTNANAEISWAHRPENSRWSFLDKAEFRYDALQNAVAGMAGPIGGAPLTVNGDVSSRRFINSLSINYTPIGNDENDKRGASTANFVEHGEYSLFWGARYVFEKFSLDDVAGWSNVIGADVRFDLSTNVDIGAAATIRIGTNGKNIAYSGGPVLTLTPFENANLSLGYNVVGFEDRDFENSRYSRNGPYLTLKLKFDQNSLAGFKF
jgi:uncharacterized repeat protein (TIGR01451 family)